MFETYEGLVRSLMARGMARQRAAVQAAISRPDLHKEFLLETNWNNPGAEFLIEEKFERAEEEKAHRFNRRR